MGFREFSIKYETNPKPLNLGDRSITYPHYNQAVVLAGDSINCKSYVLQNILNIRGELFETDSLKERVPQFTNEELDHEFGKRYGLYLNYINITDPVESFFLHEFMKEKGFNTKIKETFFNANISREHKPNVIFDITLSNLQNTNEIKDWLDFGGYDLVNRHIVWAVNEIEAPSKQSEQGEHQLSEGILLKTPMGATLTLRELIEQNPPSWFNGDVYIVFKKNIDTELTKKSSTEYRAYQLKQAGKDFQPIEQIEEQLLNRLLSYLPKE